MSCEAVEKISSTLNNVKRNKSRCKSHQEIFVEISSEQRNRLRKTHARLKAIAFERCEKPKSTRIYSTSR